MNHNTSMITERDLREVHCKPFQAAISKVKLMGVMNSYCSLNHEPVISSHRLLTGLLREEMGFDGILVSDYLSINRLLEPFCTAADALDAGIQAVKAGLDVEYPQPFGVGTALEQAIADGQLDEADIDRSVLRILQTKFKLGLFEHPYPKPGFETSFNDGKSRSVALKMARESVILLKNNHHILPLDKTSIRKIAVVGPHGDRLRSWFGSYSFPAMRDMQEDARNNLPCEYENCASRWFQRFPGDLRETPPFLEAEFRNTYPESRTMFGALCEYLPGCQVSYAMGVNIGGNNSADFDQAVMIAADADVVILTLGGQNSWGLVGTNGEGVDNYNIGLPGRQEEFAKAIRALGKKTVVVHFDGRPLASPWVASHFDAILEAWHPGEMGGQALVSVIFGDYNPAGRLPVTASRHVGQLPTYYGALRGSGYPAAGKFGIIANPYGYVNDTAFPLFPFGHGLSYTSFTYDGLELSARSVPCDGCLEVTVPVTNTGEYDGEEVIQLYYRDILSTMVRPNLMLAGFERVFIPKGQTRHIRFTIEMSQLAFLDGDMNWKVEGGEIELLAGASSAALRLSAIFIIDGDCFINPVNRAFYAEAEIVANQ